MALTASVQYDVRPRDKISAPIADNETIYLGAYVAINTAGYAVNTVDTTGFEQAGFVTGFSEENTDQTSVTGDTSASPVPEVDIDIGGRIINSLNVSGASGQTDVGALVYATDESTFTLSATTNTQEVGVVTRYRSNSDLDVLFFSLAEMRVVR